MKKQLSIFTALLLIITLLSSNMPVTSYARELKDTGSKLKEAVEQKKEEQNITNMESIDFEKLRIEAERNAEYTKMLEALKCCFNT